MAFFWASIPIGLALVAASVGIPFLLTHRGDASGQSRRGACVSRGEGRHGPHRRSGGAAAGLPDSQGQAVGQRLPLSRLVRKPDSGEEASWQAYRPR